MTKPRIALLIFMACLLAAQPVAAQTLPNFTQVSAEHNFGQQVTLHAKIETSEPVQQAQAFMRAEGDNHTITFAAQIDENGTLLARHEIAQARLRPFSEVTYWFRIVLADNTSLDSPQNSFQYNDNRFNWQNLSEGPLNIHWYDGDLAFGQKALDTARAGLENTSQILNTRLSQPVHLYIYANAEDLHTGRGRDVRR